MYRTNAQSRVLEEMFIAHNMPYILVRGTRFYDRKEIKDALAYMRLIHNPEDSVSLERIINVPAGTYELVTWDANLDSIFNFNTVVVPPGPGETGEAVPLGDVLAFRWLGI